MRYKRFAISALFLTRLFEEGAINDRFKCVKGLPKDTRFVHLIQNITDYGLIYLVVEHESFPELKVGEEIPTIEIRFEKLYA